MKRIAWRLIRIVFCVTAMWGIAATDYHLLPQNDAVAAMILLLGVLAVAALGDRFLAIATSISASLSFSYYFVESVESLRITSTEGAVAFATMLITAMAGSQMAVRVQFRAAEAERRRAEMARLQQLGAALLTTDTINNAGEKAVREIVSLFGGGAVLRVIKNRSCFEAGAVARGGPPPIRVHTPGETGVLELYGMEPSIEVRSALANLIGLVLERAVAAEERAHIETVQRGEELRNTILNALAHNFRTPLTCIKAAASMMRGSDSSPGSYRQELVEVIDEEADTLDSLIRDSLDTARIQSRQANPRVENCSVASIVSGVLDKRKRCLARHGVRVDIPETLPVIRGDRFLFEQMITQILDNAWKYAAPGARIWVSARHADDQVVLTIRNEGKQIPEEERTRVFDRFYRGARSRASIEGTGLGLAIAKTIAETYGGKVWLQAAAEGPEFGFSLPAGPIEEEEYDREPHYIAD